MTHLEVRAALRLGIPIYCTLSINPAHLLHKLWLRKMVQEPGDERITVYHHEAIDRDIRVCEVTIDDFGFYYNFSTVSPFAQDDR